jgi:hypothetical protein
MCGDEEGGMRLVGQHVSRATDRRYALVDRVAFAS